MTNLEITNAYVGNTQVEKIYLGTDIVWGGGSGAVVTIYDSLGQSTADTFSNGIIPDEQYRDRSDIARVVIGSGITSIGISSFAYVFAGCSNLTSVTIGNDVEFIGGRAFENTPSLSAITIPASVTGIGTNAFYNFDSQDTITFEGDIPRFRDEDLGSGTQLIVPDIYLGNYCSFNSIHDNNYNIVSDLGNICQEPDPCEGLTGESLCNCQGRYWWGGECHDEPDTMPTTPLTFEITSVGTGSTGSIGLRLSGDTGWANKRQLTYYLTHEGTETSGKLMLNEAVSNSAITSLITGLTVGDKIVFWGWGDQRGMSVSESAFEYFVTSAGVTAKVYGNVNSLLFAGAFYHGGPVPQTAETAAYAFYKLFQNKTGFTFGAPNELQHIVLPVPANGLQNSIYREMFYGCTNMTTAPELPATTLAASCYRSMFNGAGLTTAPELPATTMADYAYLSMFADCPITQAPALPATTLAQNCYSNMFRGTNITDMPDLPATTVVQYCYQGMFSACTSLTGVTAELPALQAEPFCYQSMFDGCASLTTAPALPATGLSNACYQEMFGGCTNLTTAPALPATGLSNACYQEMFRGCTSLTQAPELPATTLAGNYCYRYMFRNCTLLNYVKALATNSGTRFNPNWLSGVAANGTFVKHPDATWTSGVSGIPTGWTIEDADV